MLESMYLKSTKARFMNHRNQHIISRLAIWLLAIVMIIFGIQHFRHPDIFANFVPPYLPGGDKWVYLVGAAFILAALAFITNKFVALAGYLLAALLLLFIITIHWPNFKDASSVENSQATLSNMLKDLAIAAFALYIASNSRHQKVPIAD
jgi:putative oxidoreductase